MPEINNAPKMGTDEAKNIISSLDPEKILKVSYPKSEEAVMESMSNDRASREPLPGVSEEIFNLEPLVVKTSKGDVTVRPMVAYDINCFKKIDSPFYKILMDDTKDMKETNSLFTTEEEAYALVFQFTTPPKQLYQVLKKGAEAFKDMAMEEIAFKYIPDDVAKLVVTIMEHIFRVNMARVNFDVAEHGDSEKKTKLMSPETIATTNLSGSQAVKVG